MCGCKARRSARSSQRGAVISHTVSCVMEQRPSFRLKSSIQDSVLRKGRVMDDRHLPLMSLRKRSVSHSFSGDQQGSLLGATRTVQRQCSDVFRLGSL